MFHAMLMVTKWITKYILQCYLDSIDGQSQNEVHIPLKLFQFLFLSELSQLIYNRTQSHLLGTM